MIKLSQTSIKGRAGFVLNYSSFWKSVRTQNIIEPLGASTGPNEQASFFPNFCPKLLFLLSIYTYNTDISLA